MDAEIRNAAGAEFYADMRYVWECGIVFLDINMEVYFNEYRSLKNGQGAGLEELPDYLEEKPSFDRKA